MTIYLPTRTLFYRPPRSLVFWRFFGGDGTSKASPSVGEASDGLLGVLWCLWAGGSTKCRLEFLFGRMFGVDGGILASVGVFFICVVIFPGNLIFLGFLGVTKPTEVLDGFSSADDMQG